MEARPYDVWYDPNEVDAENRAQVRRDWARPDLQITYGKVILVGDDEVAPVPARIISFDEASGIITLKLLFENQPNCCFLTAGSH